MTAIRFSPSARQIAWPAVGPARSSAPGVLVMSPGLRLWLLPLLIAACAHQQLVVPESDWERVPAAQRSAIDRKHEAQLVSARAELKAATTGLAEVQRPPATAAGGARAMARPDPDAD